MMPSKPLIADIQRFSLHDGPGIRTTVFFKGCPLNCAWCHNPECISFAPETLFYPHRCVGCGGCAEGCFSDAKVLCGREYTPEELRSQFRLPEWQADTLKGTEVGVKMPRLLR